MKEKALITRRNSCRLCKSKNLSLVLSLEPTPVGDAYLTTDQLHETQETYPLDLFLCLDCSHAQLLDIIDPEVLYRNFVYETSISLGLVEHFQSYAENVLSRFPCEKNSLVIDIGSNDGTLLKFLQKKGMRVLGIDPARDIAQKATLEGVKTLPIFFNARSAEEIKKDLGAATIITANNAFANLDDLDDMIEGVRSLLSPDGFFIIETGYLVDLVQKGLFDNIYHEHLGYFSIKPLIKFFDRHQMKVADVEHVPTKGGSIRLVVQSVSSSRKISSSVGKFVELEEHLGIDTPEPFCQLAQKLENVREKLISILTDIKKDDKKIAAYGASVGSTTLLYHFQLRPFIDFLIDDNKAKHNTFSPGYHIPTKSSEILYEERPHYVVILSWRYAEPIIKKHTRYLEEGGQFLVPYPEIAIQSQTVGLACSKG